MDIQVDSGQTTRNRVCKIDTGAKVNVIPLDLYTQLHPHSLYDYSGRPVDLTPSSTNITAFGGHVIKQYGTCMLTLSHKGIGNKYPFLNTSGDMKLVTLNYSITSQHVSKSALHCTGFVAVVG